MGPPMGHPMGGAGAPCEDRNGPLADAADRGLAAEDVLRAEDVAALLGVDRKTVYAAVGRRELPYRRLGRKLLFSRRALLEWWTAQGRVVSERK